MYDIVYLVLGPVNSFLQVLVYVIAWFAVVFGINTGSTSNAGVIV